ncbi:MAG: hypothetical protein AB8B56_01285 [Crocinitomicaceae bacterium]
MQTAKPTPVGTLERSGGISGYVDHGNVYPSFDGMLRTGIYEKADIGLAYSLGTLGHLKLDFKHQLYASPDRNWFLSAGIGVDGIWSEEILGPTNQDIGLTLPLYFSFNHNGSVTPYFAQRATLGLTDVGTLSQYGKAPELEVFDLNHDWYYSGGAGIRWGEKNVRWFAELSYVFQFNRVYFNDVFINGQGMQETSPYKGITRSGTAQLAVGLFFGR